MALLVVVGLGVAISFGDDHVLFLLWSRVVVCATAATLTVTLRVAAKSISVAWCQPFGWVRDETRLMIFVNGVPLIRRRARTL